MRAVPSPGQYPLTDTGGPTAGGIKVNTRLARPNPQKAAYAAKQPARHTPEEILLANRLSSDVVSQQRTTPLHD